VGSRIAYRPTIDCTPAAEMRTTAFIIRTRRRRSARPDFSRKRLRVPKTKRKKKFFFSKNVVCPRLHQTCMNTCMSGNYRNDPLISHEICNECLSQSLKVGISDFVPEVGSDRQPLGPPLCVRGSRSVGVAPITGGSASASRFASACRCT